MYPYVRLCYTASLRCPSRVGADLTSPLRAPCPPPEPDLAPAEVTAAGHRLTADCGGRRGGGHSGTEPERDGRAVFVSECSQAVKIQCAFFKNFMLTLAAPRKHWGLVLCDFDSASDSVTIISD